VDALLERFLNEAGDPTASTPNGDAPPLPVWHFGVRSLHRRDIYDDVC
jgi:hypothetical protein